MLKTDDLENVSLAENIIRASMHRADQYEAFAAQIDSGKSISQVADMYGVSETVVNKRLKLGRVAPKILDAYRAGKIEFNEVAAFALSDDQERQLAVFKANPKARSHTIRSALTMGEVPNTDKRVRFVGVAAYVQAGGGVRHDLFADREDACFLTDAALLDRLHAEKIETICEEVRTEGWGKVSLYSGDYYTLANVYRGRVYPKPRILTEAEEAQRKDMRTRLEELVNAVNADPDNAELAADYEKQSAALDAFNVESFTPEDMARAEAVLTFDYQGNLSIHRGLTLKPLTAAVSANGANKIFAAVDADGVPLPSQAMRDELAAVRTAMIAADLSSNPHVAIATTVYALAVELLWKGSSRAEPSIQIDAEDGMPWAVFPERKMQPLGFMAAKRDSLRNGLPQRLSDWFAHFLVKSDEELMVDLAILTALSLRVYGYVGAGKRCHGDELAKAVGTKPERWVTLSDLDYLHRSSKKQILAAIEKVHGKDKAENMVGMKKAALVEAATGYLDGKWLPSQLSAFASKEDHAHLAKDETVSASAIGDDIDDEDVGLAEQMDDDSAE